MFDFFEARARAERERAKRERAKREVARATWIAGHGSHYLQQVESLGYYCQRQYATERAKQEAPDCLLDLNNTARWRERSCPSQQALNEADRLAGCIQCASVEVVWLTVTPSDGVQKDDDNNEPFEACEACEAVVVHGFLEQYDLVHWV